METLAGPRQHSWHRCLKLTCYEGGFDQLMNIILVNRHTFKSDHSKIKIVTFHLSRGCCENSFLKKIPHLRKLGETELLQLACVFFNLPFANQVHQMRDFLVHGNWKHLKVLPKVISCSN